MTRLMDLGMDNLRNMLLDMAQLSETTISAALDAYTSGRNVENDIFQRSEGLKILQEQISDLCVELIARYQPVASDLRYIRSCMEIAYGYSRFGRYAYDISQVFGIFGDLSDCDKVVIEKAGRKAVEMVHLSNKAFTERNGEVAKQVKDMDDDIDRTYLDFVTKAAKSKADNLACVLSGVLILRYLERIADHATYVGDSVLYIISGTRASKQ